MVAQSHCYTLLYTLQSTLRLCQQFFLHISMGLVWKLDIYQFSSNNSDSKYFRRNIWMLSCVLTWQEGDSSGHARVKSLSQACCEPTVGEAFSKIFWLLIKTALIMKYLRRWWLGKFRPKRRLRLRRLRRKKIEGLGQFSIGNSCYE